MIRKNSNKLFLTLGLFVCLSGVLPAQLISPFNKLRVKDSLTDYHFIVSGHFHGASNNRSTFPAASLLANIDTLNAINPLFLMCLGDLYANVNDTYIQHYQKSLFDKLKMPLFNAVGNHDVENDNLYEKTYGQTFFSFTNASELFIVLNTELNDGSIKNEQLLFLTNTLKEAENKNIKNIFIFSHRPIWAERLEKYNKLFKNNTRTHLGENNFLEDVLPLFQNVAQIKNVFWMSGSMDDAPTSFFYDKHESTNITFMQTAIRDLPRDAFLEVFIRQGKVSFNGISLTGSKLEKVENYNFDYWTKLTVGEFKIDWKLLPYDTWMMLRYHHFWIGFGTALMLVCIFLLIRNKLKK